MATTWTPDCQDSQKNQKCIDFPLLNFISNSMHKSKFLSGAIFITAEVEATGLVVAVSQNGWSVSTAAKIYRYKTLNSHPSDSQSSTRVDYESTEAWNVTWWLISVCSERQCYIAVGTPCQADVSVDHIQCRIVHKLAPGEYCWRSFLVWSLSCPFSILERQNCFENFVFAFRKRFVGCPPLSKK